MDIFSFQYALSLETVLSDWVKHNYYFLRKKNGFLGYQSRNEDLTTVVGSQKFEISSIEELSRMFPFQFL